MYEYLKTGESLEHVTIRMAGRIVKIRSAGSSLRFYVCKVEGLSIQILCDSRLAAEGHSFNNDLFHLGDWIGVIGFPGRTQPRRRPQGELSVFAREIVLLSPCLRQLPSLRYGFHNQEKRYRQRYLDLIMNDSTRNVFGTRTKIIKYIRRFFDDRDFLEVQTPMMNQIPGGALAKPFKTFHNDLNTELFLRVTPELSLKMLLVGSLEKVYEIGQNFRNEDIDLTHNPEFTSLSGCFLWRLPLLMALRLRVLLVLCRHIQRSQSHRRAHHRHGQRAHQLLPYHLAQGMNNV